VSLGIQSSTLGALETKNRRPASGKAAGVSDWRTIVYPRTRESHPRSFLSRWHLGVSTARLPWSVSRPAPNGGSVDIKRRRNSQSQRANSSEGEPKTFGSGGQRFYKGEFSHSRNFFEEAPAVVLVAPCATLACESAKLLELLVFDRSI